MAEKECLDAQTDGMGGNIAPIGVSETCEGNPCWKLVLGFSGAVTKGADCWQ